MDTTSGPAEQAKLIRGMPYIRYAALGRLRSSNIITAALHSLKRARYEMANPRPPTPALAFGALTHTATLEPAALHARYAVAPKVGRRSKAERQIWEEFSEANPGREAVAEDDLVRAVAISEAVHSHPWVGSILASKGPNEVVVTWTDPATDLPCQLRADAVRGGLDGWTYVLDLKTAPDVRPRRFGYSVRDYGYVVQAAHYLAGFAALSDVPRRFVLVAVEKEPPYDVVPYEVTVAELEWGASVRARTLARWRTAMDTGYWPGYSNGLLAISSLTEYDLRKEDL